MSQLRFLGQEVTGLGNCRCFTLSLGSGLLLVSSLFLSSPGPSAGCLWWATAREPALGTYVKDAAGCWHRSLWAKESWGYLDIYSGISSPL